LRRNRLATSRCKQSGGTCEPSKNSVPPRSPNSWAKISSHGPLGQTCLTNSGKWPELRNHAA
jgi:hypothetical protein